MRTHLVVISLVAVAIGGSGCAAVGMTLVGVGTGQGVSYTLDSIAYRTFAASETDVAGAAMKALDRMAIDVNENQPTPTGRKIVATAGDRTIDIELERLTPRTSHMRVTATHRWILRDRATATEIVAETGRALASEPDLARAPAGARP